MGNIALNISDYCFARQALSEAGRPAYLQSSDYELPSRYTKKQGIENRMNERLSGSDDWVQTRNKITGSNSNHP